MKRAYVFPGQGSQRKGMGEGLFEEFQDLTDKADSILGYSIKELCLEDPQSVLNQTQYTQPALYVVTIFKYLEKIEKNRKKPDYLAGHSLGEYSALFAAGAFDFETGLKLTQQRSMIMAEAQGGGMAAVIGLKEDEIKEVLQNNRIDTIDIANYNSPSQTVISGPREVIQKSQEVFMRAGAKIYIPLPVSGAFHSRYMKESGNKFLKFLEGFDFSDLKIPVISNAEAREYKRDKIKQLLADQINCPVRWAETIRYLMEKGVVEFEEIGYGRVLTGLITAIKQEAEARVMK